MGEMQARRTLTGEERGPARRAHRRRGVRLREAQTVAGETVEIRGAMVGVTVAREIEGAQIVDHDDDDARPLRQARPTTSGRDQHGGERTTSDEQSGQVELTRKK